MILRDHMHGRGRLGARGRGYCGPRPLKAIGTRNARRDFGGTCTSRATRFDAHGAIAAKAVADAERLYTVRRILPIDGPIKYGEWHWDDEGVPDGPLLVTVDLQARTISIFRGGYEIGAAAVLLGTDEHPTPTGVFPILWKQRHNAQRNTATRRCLGRCSTSDGVAIHGGSEVENGYASHGCIGVPDPIAERLFAIATTGDKVVITDGQRIGMGDSII